MCKFEVGKAYESFDSGRDPVTVVKRTPKTATVSLPSGHSWRMKIRTDDNGNEYLLDSTVPKSHRELFGYSAAYEAR